MCPRCERLKEKHEQLYDDQNSNSDTVISD